MLKENQRVFDYIGLTQYHNKGYTGKGMPAVVWEPDADHRKTVTKALLQSAPDCEIVYVSDLYNDAVKNILASGAKIVTLSYANKYLDLEESQQLVDAGITLFVAVGNKDTRDTADMAEDPNWISVGALTMVNEIPSLEIYSSRSPVLDTVAFIPYVPGGSGPYIPSGTSFASPFLAGLMACYYQYFFDRYGRYPVQSEVVELIKDHGIDLGAAGRDNNYGNGLLVLPEPVLGGEITTKEYIVLHHSAGADGVVRDYDAIKKYHMEHNGWRDIGYMHVVERVNGVLVDILGRDENDVGAHCPGRNGDGIGVCVVGDFTNAPPDDETYAFVAEVCKGIKSRHPIKEIGGHRDYGATACPGDMFDVDRVKQLMEEGSIVGEDKNKVACKINIKGKEFPGYIEGGQAKFDGADVTDVIDALNNAYTWDEKTMTVNVK